MVEQQKQTNSDIKFNAFFTHKNIKLNLYKNVEIIAQEHWVPINRIKTDASQTRYCDLPITNRNRSRSNKTLYIPLLYIPKIPV